MGRCGPRAYRRRMAAPAHGTGPHVGAPTRPATATSCILASTPDATQAAAPSKTAGGRRERYGRGSKRAGWGRAGDTNRQTARLRQVKPGKWPARWPFQRGGEGGIVWRRARRRRVCKRMWRGGFGVCWCGTALVVLAAMHAANKTATAPRFGTPQVCRSRSAKHGGGVCWLRRSDGTRPRAHPHTPEGRAHRMWPAKAAPARGRLPVQPDGCGAQREWWEGNDSRGALTCGAGRARAEGETNKRANPTGSHHECARVGRSHTRAKRGRNRRVTPHGVLHCHWRTSACQAAPPSYCGSGCAGATSCEACAPSVCPATHPPAHNCDLAAQCYGATPPPPPPGNLHNHAE